MTANKKLIKFIVVQGSSCAGKSVFTDYLVRNLKKQIKVELLALDNFYHGTSFDYKDAQSENYDFDNPAALNWDKLKEVIKSYCNGDEFINTSEYDFATQKRRDQIIKNTYPDVIIVEGIYGFNLFNSKVFDCTRLDPFKEPLEHDKPLEYYYKLNDLKIDADVIKIELLMDKSRMKMIRMNRDCQMRFKDSTSSFVDMLNKRFERLIWPATEKWVYTKYNKPDIIIKGGTFNQEECLKVGEKLFIDLVGKEFERDGMIFDKLVNMSSTSVIEKD